MIESLLPDDSPLRVSRVRSYRVPRYPAHNDPDPTTTPQPIPYPWKSGVAAALLALGETSCDRGKTESGTSKSPLWSERAISPSEVTEIDQILAAALRETPKGDQNPFAQALGFSGLPHVSSSFGTGAPMPLDTVIAQKLITRLFTAEGLQPQPTTFTEDAFTATAQGYDPEKRIGFIIGAWGNLADDAVIGWQTNYLKAIASGEAKPTASDEVRLREIIEEMDNGLVSLSDEQKQNLKAIRKLETPQAKGQAYLALVAKLDEPKLSMAEIEHAEKVAEAHQRYLAIITVFDRRFEIPDGGTPEFLIRLDAIEESAAKKNFAAPSEKRKWIREQQASINVEMRRQQLVKLAQSVREYIAWARRNGLQ